MATARTRAPLAPLLTALVALPAFGLDNGLARVPQMGNLGLTVGLTFAGSCFSPPAEG